MSDPYHWPPELTRLLCDALPLLCRSKNDILVFLRGAGTSESVLAPWRQRLAHDRNSVRKHDIARDVLEALSEGGDATLGARRQLLKRVCEFEDYSVCWESDALRARGLVAAIRELVNRKDSFTRMREERERERAERQQELARANAETRRRREETGAIKADLYNLFSTSDPWRRGKSLEGVLNRWFAAAGIHVRDAFVVRGNAGEGVVEQVDGLVDLNGQLYLVEAKWHAEKIGTAEISQHLVRVFSRGGARGIFIASEGYTDAAIATCRQSLGQITIALCDLQELVLLLEYEHDLRRLLSRKIEIAIADREPYRRILCSPTTGP